MATTEFFYPVNKETIDWSGFTLIMPCIAVGNVAQLSVDLLISTLIENKTGSFAGYVFTQDLIPIVGPNPYCYGSPIPMTTCQVYSSSVHKLVIIQQRAPCFKERRSHFLKKLTNWIKSIQLKQVIIMTSSFSEYLPCGLNAEGKFPFRYHVLERCDSTTKESLKSLNWEQLTNGENEEDGLNLSENGFAKSLLKLCDLEAINAIIMVQYCSEGDNTNDAVELITKLNEWIKIKQSSKVTGRVSWTYPISWTRMFGEEAPTEIY